MVRSIWSISMDEAYAFFLGKWYSKGLYETYEIVWLQKFWYYGQNETESCFGRNSFAWWSDGCSLKEGIRKPSQINFDCVHNSKLKLRIEK